jgi:hypothetical protein
MHWLLNFSEISEIISGHRVAAVLKFDDETWTLIGNYAGRAEFYFLGNTVHGRRICKIRRIVRIVYFGVSGKHCHGEIWPAIASARVKSNSVSMSMDRSGGMT